MVGYLVIYYGPTNKTRIGLQNSHRQALGLYGLIGPTYLEQPKPGLNLGSPFVSQCRPKFYKVLVGQVQTHFSSDRAYSLLSKLQVFFQACGLSSTFIRKLSLPPTCHPYCPNSDTSKNESRFSQAFVRLLCINHSFIQVLVQGQTRLQCEE